MLLSQLFRSFVPLRNPIGFGASDFIELAFALLLVVKAVTVRSRRWIVAATVVALVAPAVRGELVMVLATFILAWVWIAWQSPRGRAWRAGGAGAGPGGDRPAVRAGRRRGRSGRSNPDGVRGHLVAHDPGHPGDGRRGR